MLLLNDNEVRGIVNALDSSTFDASDDDLLRDENCGPPLRAYLALTDGRLGAELSPQDQVYNRYLWFRRFAIEHNRLFGFDAGVEQQTMQILENADCEIDWNAIQELDLKA